MNPGSHPGEVVHLPERMIVAPGPGVFRPRFESAPVGGELLVDAGETIGEVVGPGTATPVVSPFRGRLMGMMAHAGERLREGQPVAWLRVA